MSFVLPALLWLLPLAAIPVVLHLLTLHRLKTVELSTYRFLFDSYIQQRRRMQFLEALLALLRTLFLALIVMMAAGPMLGAVAGLNGPVHYVLMVDCSPSMHAGTEGQTAFEQARKAARALLKTVRDDDTLTVLQVSGAEPKQIYSGRLRPAGAERKPGDSDPRKSADEVVESLTVGASRGDVCAALQKAFPEAQKRPNTQFFLITDCQASGWREVRDQGLKGLIPDHAPFTVVNVGTDDLPNRAVLGDAPAESGAVVGLPYFFQARVANTSRTETAEVTLSVILKDKEADKEAGRTSLTLKPGQTAVHRFAYTPRVAGPLRGRFEIAGAPADHFPDDDRFRFALNVAPRIRAVIVDGTPPGAPPDPSKADLSEAHYLNVALTSTDRTASAGAAAADAADGPVRPFDVRVVAEAALTPPAAGQAPDALKDADVVVLANCGTLQAPQFAALLKFVGDGGGLLIFPGDHVNPQVYDDQFFKPTGAQGDHLTAARLDAPEGDPDKDGTWEQFGRIDFGHPALTLFDDADAAVRPLSAARIYRRFKIQLPEQKAGVRGLAWFSSGSPALVESRLGDGDVILSAFPAHMRWTNLPAGPDFTPLVMQLAHHVARRPAVKAPTVALADGEADFAVDSRWGEVRATVTKPPRLGPDGRGGVTPPLQEGDAGRQKPVEVTFERRGPRLRASFADTSAPGYYTLNVESTEARPGSPAERAFAVNLSPEESDFTMVNADQVRDLLPRVDLTWLDYPKDAKQIEDRRNGGGAPIGDVWWVLILLVIFGNELFLALRTGRRSNPGDEEHGPERVRGGRAGSWVGGMAGARSP